MKMNKNGVQLCGMVELAKNDLGDTALRLDCLGYGGSSLNRFVSTENNAKFDFSNCPDDGCRLVLGLGPAPTAQIGDCDNVGMDKTKVTVTTALSPIGVPSEDDSILKLGLPGRVEENFHGFDFSVSESAMSALPQSHVYGNNNRLVIPVVDEGSTSAKQSGGYMPSLLLAPKESSGNVPMLTKEVLNFGSKSCHQLKLCNEPSATSDFSIATNSEQTTTTASSDYRSGNTKKCMYFGCTKGARGASGLCIGHGGGQRCQKPGCNKGSESRTAYCKSHGGGRRCQQLGCTKSAEGKTDFCISHGGGRRCGFPEGCTKAARGKSGLCIRHGGGKRCKIEGCTRSAEGQAGLCISHGGGRRCQYPSCTKGAQGSTMFCKAHGGGKRCIFGGCTKGAEGSTPLCKAHGGGKRCLYDGGGICPKSVHGGTNFCVAHGGGKRCIVPGCTKSARGRTDCCVKHGGGKRCKYENCEKSAQGSTDFCKAHGGGKRCCWGEGKCEKFARGKSGLCAAHTNIIREQDFNKGSLIGPGLFHGLVSTSSAAVSSTDNNCSSGVSTISDCIDSLDKPAKRQHLIPPQVLVPLSMKSSSHTSSHGADKKEETRNGYFPSTGGVNMVNIGGLKTSDYMVPEGRVHGGGLMSLFGGDLKKAINGT